MNGQSDIVPTARAFSAYTYVYDPSPDDAERTITRDNVIRSMRMDGLRARLAPTATALARRARGLAFSAAGVPFPVALDPRLPAGVAVFRNGSDELGRIEGLS